MSERVLVLAGFDPSGGAGLLLDTKMFTLLGHKVASVPTALTFQNTKTFEDWIPLAKNHYEKMLKLTLEDLPIKGVKIGMLGTPEILEVTAHYLRKYRSQIKWIILDPVLSATLKKSLYQGETFLDLLKSELFPLTDIATPNLSEAELLTGLKIENYKRDVKQSCEILKNYGIKYPLITGYHRGGLIYNYLLGKEAKIFSAKALPYEFHGTGCALSSLILGYLLKNNSLEMAIKKAMQKLSQLLQRRTSQQAYPGLQLIH